MLLAVARPRRSRVNSRRHKVWTRFSSLGTESLQTHRWRKRDSNRWSLSWDWGISDFGRLTDRCALRLDMRILDGRRARVSGHDRVQDLNVGGGPTNAGARR